jgi:probable LLM family oxidoreductase
MMEIGIDSFAASSENQRDGSKSLRELLERIQLADQVGLDSFGIGEHHRKEFLDSSPTIILAAAASITKNIRLTSAVTVLSAADPVRVFQNFATLDLISDGRAEIIAGRGSFTDAYPLFGFSLHDYDALFKEKLELLLQIRDNEVINWSGKFRPPLQNQAIYPRPKQEKLPIWLGVGGTPASFVRAGQLGLPLMVAVIGGETHRFRPLIDLYRQAGQQAGFSESDLKVGLHSLGYVGKTKQEAVADFYPKYAEMFTKIGRERGFPPVTKDRFDAQNGTLGALMVGDPKEIADKILRHGEALGGISRVTLQMDAMSDHKKLMQSIELMGKEVMPLLKSK